MYAYPVFDGDGSTIFYFRDLFESVQPESLADYRRHLRTEGRPGDARLFAFDVETGTENEIRAPAFRAPCGLYFNSVDRSLYLCAGTPLEARLQDGFRFWMSPTDSYDYDIRYRFPLAFRIPESGADLFPPIPLTRDLFPGLSSIAVEGISRDAVLVRASPPQDQSEPLGPILATIHEEELRVVPGSEGRGVLRAAMSFDGSTIVFEWIARSTQEAREYKSDGINVLREGRLQTLDYGSIIGVGETYTAQCEVGGVQ